MSTPTRFDPIIQAVTRRAETIYSKMAIRRDESEDLGRRKKEDGDNQPQSIPWEDTTEVSIIALRSFLEDLLGLGHANTAIQTPTPAPHDQTASPATARAIHAYQTTGMAVHDRNVETTPPPETPKSGTDVQLGNDFGEEEQARIKDYISDMAKLEAKGITTLTLRRSLTFLESIHQAIDDAKE